MQKKIGIIAKKCWPEKGIFLWAPCISGSLSQNAWTFLPRVLSFDKRPGSLRVIKGTLQNIFRPVFETYICIA